MRKFLFLILLIFGFCFRGHSQKQAYNWYFGVHAGLNFSTSTPTVLTNGQTNTNEGVATISDTSGNLLFYTDGVTVWNKLHQVMQNGTGLWGHYSATQSAVIVPQPGNDSIYFLFTVDWIGQPHGLCYSVINIKLDNGLGAVVQKNIQLLTPTTEKITAVRHCNNKDVWVITHNWNDDKYYAWLVTSFGINNTAVISSTGNSIFNSALGYLKTSPNGKKLISAFYEMQYLELCDFNNQTGAISNPVKIRARPPVVTIQGRFQPYGVEFSPDNNLLYATSEVYNFELNSSNFFYLHQFNVSTNDSAMIEASRVLVDSQNVASSVYMHDALQVAVNGKIYLAETDINQLSVINNPNVQGTGCNFQLGAINLGTGMSRLGLPTFIQNYFDPNFVVYDFSAANNCNSYTVPFAINNTTGYDSLKWNFGDAPSGINNYSGLANPIHVFTSAGVHNVQLIIFRNSGCSYPDTIQKQIWAGPLVANLGNDTTICQGDTLFLDQTIPAASYQWSNGSTGSGLNVSQPGQYWVQLTVGNCTASDTINVAVQQLPVFSLGNDTAICMNQSLTLSPVPNPPNVNYNWNTGATTSSININNAGQYWLQLNYPSSGCSFRDTINIQWLALPNFSLGNDTALCQPNDLSLNATVNGASAYLWNTGDTSPVITVNQTGIYWADVNKNNCIYRDSIDVVFNSIPLVSIGNDTTICEGQLLLLNAQNAGAQFLWQDNSNQQTFTASQQGKYWVKVTSSGCSATDTINILYQLKPKFSLGPDLGICEGMSLILQPAFQNSAGSTYLWQNGATTPTFTVTQPGLYSLSVTNNCGSKIDSVVVFKGICKIYVPTAFSPNKDGLNDVFRAKFGENITSFRLQIFNRWGEKVFESADINSGWDGMFKGVLQPIGLYAWLITYKTISEPKEQTMKGTVLLTR